MNDGRHLLRIGGDALAALKAWGRVDGKHTNEVLEEAIGCYHACRKTRADGGRIIAEDRKGEQSELLVGSAVESREVEG